MVHKLCRFAKIARSSIRIYFIMMHHHRECPKNVLLPANLHYELQDTKLLQLKCVDVKSSISWSDKKKNNNKKKCDTFLHVLTGHHMQFRLDTPGNVLRLCLCLCCNRTHRDRYGQPQRKSR